MSENALVPVDPSNVDQATAWDGEGGAYWTEHATTFDRSVAAHDGPFMAAAAIGPDDRVLDVGCGSGRTTRQAARLATSGSALGVDLSSRQVELARRLAAAEGMTNVDFEQTDAQIHPFAPESFDVAISHTGAMFFGDPVAAFANIRGALRPGGRLVLLTWQPVSANPWFLQFTGALAAGRDLPAPPADAPGPFSMSDPQRVRSILEDAGFTDVAFDSRQDEMWFGDTADDAFHFLLGLFGWMLGLDDEGRARGRAALRETLNAHEGADGVVYPSAVWIIRAVRA